MKKDVVYCIIEDGRAGGGRGGGRERGGRGEIFIMNNKLQIFNDEIIKMF
jgi:hypothetical protein